MWKEQKKRKKRGQHAHTRDRFDNIYQLQASHITCDSCLFCSLSKPRLRLGFVILLANLISLLYFTKTFTFNKIMSAQQHDNNRLGQIEDIQQRSWHQNRKYRLNPYLCYCHIPGVLAIPTIIAMDIPPFEALKKNHKNDLWLDNCSTSVPLISSKYWQLRVSGLKPFTLVALNMSKPNLLYTDCEPL